MFFLTPNQQRQSTECTILHFSELCAKTAENERTCLGGPMRQTYHAERSSVVVPAQRCDAIGMNERRADRRS